MERSRKVYRPSGMPTYNNGGTTKKYSTKGYKKAQEKGGLLSDLTKHFGHGEIIEAIGGTALDIWAYADQKAALNELMEGVDDPSEVVGDTATTIGAITDAGGAPTPSTEIQDFITKMEGMSTDVEIDTSALDKTREGQEQITADVVSQMGKGGTKGLAGLTDVLASQDKSDLGILEQELGIETTETSLEEQAKQKKLQEISGLTQAYGQQEFATSQDLFGAYTDDLSSASQFLQQLQLGSAGLSLPGILGANLAKEGMKTPEGEATMKEGEEVMEAGEPEISPGEEKHETNPIDLVRDGEKIGEMTGGEVIMPSKDVEVLESLLRKGDGESIMKLMATLMLKWSKKAQEYAEKEIGGAVEAKGGMRTYNPSSKINY